MAKVVYTVFVHVTPGGARVQAPIFPGVHFTSDSMARTEEHFGEYLSALRRLLHEARGIFQADPPKTFCIHNVFVQVEPMANGTCDSSASSSRT